MFGVKAMKKITSVLLSLVMILSALSALPLEAYADELTTGSCGENVTYAFDSDTGILTISGTGEMEDDDISPFEEQETIKKVIIENGVTSIGSSAFSKCTNLTDIILPKGLTEIKNNTFWGCEALTNIMIPDTVTNIKYQAFYGCSSLTAIAIPDGVTSIERSTFERCTSLSDVSIGSSVIIIGESARTRQ